MPETREGGYQPLQSESASEAVLHTEGRTIGRELFDAHAASRKELKTSQEQDAFFYGLSAAFQRGVGESLQEKGMPELIAIERAHEITASYMKFIDELGKDGLGFGRISDSLREEITRSETGIS